MSGIELLTRTYEQLSVIGAVATKAEFSCRFLGKSPSYMTSMQARGRAVSDEVLETLENNMLAEIRRTAKSGDAAMQALNVRLRRIHAKIEMYRADRWLREAAHSRMEILTSTAAEATSGEWDLDHSGLLPQMPAAIYWLLGRARA
ncbi:MAG TPA: DUF6626 family protein [Devosia sp.]|nr:DUF6626 family protein [Devosia sp.]